jgi:hypothetical protein
MVICGDVTLSNIVQVTALRLWDRKLWNFLLLLRPISSYVRVYALGFA